MMRTAALLWFAKDLTYPPAVIETAARYDRLWIYPHVDGRSANGVPDFTSIDATIAQIRAVKPDQWIGLYTGGVMFKREIDPLGLWLTDADLLHKPDGSPLVYHDTTATFSPPNDVFTYCAPDLTDRAVIDKIANGYVAFVQQHGLNGILLDGFDADFYAALTRGVPSDLSGMFGATAGCLEGPMHQASAWVAPLAALGDRLRWYLEPLGVEFVFNGIHPGFDNATKLPHASGAMMEAIGVAYGDVAAFTGIIDVVKDAVGRGRRVYMSAMPWYTKPTGLAVQRFYLGLYLLCAAPGVSFTYSPWVPYRAWDGNDGATDTGRPHGNPAVFWSPDWDLDFGYPITPCMIGSPVTVAWREFSRCYVVVNPNDTYQQMNIAGSYRLWDPVSGPVFGGLMNIPPKETWVMWKAATS